MASALKLLAWTVLLAMMVELRLLVREKVFVGPDPYLEEVR